MFVNGGIHSYDLVDPSVFTTDNDNKIITSSHILNNYEYSRLKEIEGIEVPADHCISHCR